LTVGEGGIRTPLIISGPRIDGPRLVDSFAYVTDLMPMLLELAEVEHPDQYRGRDVARMRGRSLSGVTFGDQDHTYAEDAIIAGEMINGKWVRQGDYKATSVAPQFGDGQWRLYNIKEDPGETRDLAVERSELLEELTAAWERYARDVGVVTSN
jgi:arylsulfatase